LKPLRCENLKSHKWFKLHTFL
jgi:hypothetical protein